MSVLLWFCPDLDYNKHCIHFMVQSGWNLSRVRFLQSWAIQNVLQHILE